MESYVLEIVLSSSLENGFNLNEMIGSKSVNVPALQCFSEL